MADWFTEYDAQHFYFTWGGYTVGGFETWQCGTRYFVDAIAGDNGIEQALTHISMSDCWQILATMFGSGTIGARWDSSFSLEWCKLAWIGTDGKYKAEPIEHRQQRKGSLNATYTGPPQLAVCVSVSSGEKLGAGNHGRFYLPAPTEWTGTVDPSNGQVVAAHVTALQAAAVTMLKNVQGEISTVDADADLAIFSPRTPASKPGFVAVHKIAKRIGVGATTDTQRRRRRSLPDGVKTWAVYP